MDALDTNDSMESGRSRVRCPLPSQASIEKKEEDLTETPTTMTASGNVNTTTTIKGKMPPKPPEEFYKDLQQFHERRGTPITQVPKISGRIIDLHLLYSEVTERGGFLKVNMRDEWNDLLPALGLREKCVNASAAMKHIYRRCLEKYERLNYFGEDPDKIDAQEVINELLDNSRSRGRYPHAMHSATGGLNAVPMSYNYRQHIVNLDRRRMHKLSTDLYKPTPYEKLMLSLISPLPNEQDFAINVCTLMANESRHTLKLNEYPKLLNVLLAHTGVFADYSLQEVFQQVYTDVRQHSLYAFWLDLLHDKPQILDLHAHCPPSLSNGSSCELSTAISKNASLLHAGDEYDFLNLGRCEGTQEYIGQRVQQIVAILRNLSFFEENIAVLAKNRTFMRFIVMSANIRWGNIHMQALDIAGNVAAEFELLDPTVDELTRNLLATLVDGIEGVDRAVIINSLEVLYKLCQNDGNEDAINKCLNAKFCETLSLFLSLNDIMLLIFSLEAIYALTSMGARSCHLFMQVRGVIDQLVSLITVEAQAYGPDGCILMRVVETVPGNMLPLVAQNLQNVAVLQKQNQQQQQQQQQHQQVQPHVVVATPAPPQQQPAPVPQQPLAVTQLPQQPQPLQQREEAQQQPAPQPQPQQSEPANQLVKQPPPAQQQLQLITPKPPPQVQQQQQQQPAPVPQSYTQDDEQYALAWLGATFERAGTAECRVEQQELYRMYLVHCQKSNKHSLVNQMAFPRLVRLIFNSSVGPASVRRADGTDIPGLYYVNIRMRAQPLPIQSKGLQQQSPGVTPKSGEVKSKPDVSASPAASPAGRKLKKKPKSLDQTSEAPPEMSKEANVQTEADEAVAQSQQHIAGSRIGVVMVAADEGSKQTAMICDGQQQQQPSSSLIKSLLATKVTQRQQKQKDLNTMQSVMPAPQSIKVANSNAAAISALVNNPLLHHTPVKVGQTTIKPLNPQIAYEKKQLLDSAPPPLAPLSGGNVAKDASGRPVIIANQMLVEMLDKKTGEPPVPATIIKRKIDEVSGCSVETVKRIALLDARPVAKEELLVTPSKNAANLYAEMAASILEDEDLDDIPPLPAQQGVSVLQATQQQALVMPAKLQQHQTSATLTAGGGGLHRQLVFQTTGGQATQPRHAQHIPTAMATIKTDQGLQTVPVILQQKSMDGSQPQLIQQVIQQQQVAPQQTQYVLATNPQGQTYLVAQQAPQPQPSAQTVLVTQTPQQQSTGTKTIIILQQQPLSAGQSAVQQPQQQKMIMTTAQGQQVLVTQRSQPSQQQIIINPHMQHVPVCNVGGVQRQIISSPALVPQQPQPGQISPSLLSQLNHIPATIKLHQPQPQPQQQQQQQQQQQTATISRLGKTVSIVQSSQSQLPSVPIPQLQQHQSIIQQHIISGGAAGEKRQVMLGGRAIEIKETLITQTHPPLQQSQLNSQTIITKQVPQLQVQQQSHQSIVQQKVAGAVPSQQQKAIETPCIMQATLQPKCLPQAQTVMQTVLPQAMPTQATLTAATVTLKRPAAATLVSTQGSPSMKPPPQQGLASAAAIKVAGPPPLVATTAPAVTLAVSTPPSASSAATTQTKAEPTTPLKVGNAEEKTANVAPQAAQGTATTTASPISSTNSSNVATAPSQQQQQQHLTLADANWLYVCDWRNCPRRKYKSLSDLQHHACSAHCPDHLDAAAEIFCQWGVGPGLCDGIPRKRYSLMTHLQDRHITPDSLRAASQRRIATGSYNVPPSQPPVTIVRNVVDQQAQQQPRGSTASPALSTSSSGSLPTTGSSAIQAIKRHTADFINSKELMDENEGPVTKSIRLTAALILRNLVTYTNTAKRTLRRYEPHLANVALSNVESSGAISHILFELNN